MNKRTTYSLLLILCLIMGLIYYKLQQADPISEHQATGNEAPSNPHGIAPSEGRAGRAKHTNTADNTMPSDPKQVFSSSVNVNIQAGETLVMGGYQREDGKHEFTMLSPTSVTLEDGSPGIRLTSKVMALSPDAAHQSGLNTLTTKYSTANDHAEAWTQEEARSTLSSMSQANGIELMSAPSIISAPGKPFSLNMGGANGISEYSVNATISNNAKGGFTIQSHMVRTPPEQP